MNILDPNMQQISTQIESRLDIDVEVTDLKNETAFIEIYMQDKIFIRPVFKEPRILSESLLAELLNLEDKEQSKKLPKHKKYLKTNMGYNEFFDKFYNKLD